MSEQTSMSDCPASCPTPLQLQLYQAIIFATPVLFACLLLLLFCMLYLRRRRSAGSDPENSMELFARGLTPGPYLDHGLSKSFRQTLPIIPFDKKFADMREDTQCAVCLGDYQLNEKLQQLPVCKHSFHVNCIDEWLAKNTTCPMCRTSLIGEKSQDLLQPQDVNGIGLSPREDANRWWEERVVSQDGNVIRAGPTSFETAAQPSMEHAINIERS